MRKIPIHGLAAAATLGSGIITVLSVVGTGVPARNAVLHAVFPMEFLGVSRFAALVVGFSMIVSSVSIYRQKRRALYYVATLAALSVVFHLTKGLDYEEAGVSLLLLLFLAIYRGNFTVESDTPDFRWTGLRLALALFAVGLYGVLGFWVLDKRQFGIDFHFVRSVKETFWYLTFLGDPDLEPRTRHAKWFLDSLYLISGVGIAYAFWSLYRPVKYRFFDQPHARTRAAQILEKHGRSALDYFKVWPDKSYFFTESGNCFVAYRVGANLAVALGDPSGPESEMESAVREFKEYCASNDWGTAFHQALPDLLPVYEKLGYRRFKIGDDAIVELDKFSLEGRPMKEIRHTVRKLEKDGVRIQKWDPPIPNGVLQQLKSVSDEWLGISGKRERRFTLGLFDWDYVKSTPVMAAVDTEGQVLAFVNVIRSYRQGETTIDLMRHGKASPGGVMDFLFVELFQHFKAQGFSRFNLGMAPLSGFQEGEKAAVEERAIHSFMQRMDFLFSYKGLRAYKAKFATAWEPRYVLYEDPLALARFAVAMGRISEM
jgi:phosphatidylglycerol lysyltransferase